MTRWHRSVELYEEWIAVGDDESNVATFVAAAVPKLRAAGCPGRVVADLEQCDCFDSFNNAWDEVYDWADRARVWINLTSMPVVLP